MEKETFHRYQVPLLIAVAIVFPILTGMNFYLLNVLIIMFVFIIFSSAWNFLAYSGQGSLGHAAFFGIGGYISALFVLRTGIPLVLGILIGGSVAAIIGLLIGLTCVRLKEWFLAMVTFGFAIIIETLFGSLFAPITGGWDGMGAPRLIGTGIASSLMYEYYLILLIVVLCLYGFHRILRSKIGLAFAAIRENEVEARAAGVNPVRYKLMAFVISTFVAGIAGALEVHYVGYVTPEIFAAQISFWPIIYSILGGLGTIGGPVIGTVILTVVWEWLKGFGFTYERFILIGVLLILVVIFLPKGLISLPEKLREMKQKKWPRLPFL